MPPTLSALPTSLGHPAGSQFRFNRGRGPNLALRKLLPTAVVVCLTVLIWFVVPVPAGVAPNAWHLFALFIGTIAAIIGKVMPLGSLSLIAIALVAITGVTNPGKPAAALADALSGFANPLIWLIVIAVMVALAVTKTGLGRRIGYYFVRLLGRKTIGVAYGLVLSELVIAPVTPSNRAWRRHHPPHHALNRR